jgi:hypothetical protein
MYMDDKRKDLMIAGLYLGDITLALAAIAKEMPSYVQGFDLEKVVPEAEGLDPARREVDSILAGREAVDAIPPEFLRRILETAIENGKFHSAARCLVLLGERDAYVEKFIGSAGEKLRAGDLGGAARDIVIASNLESDTGFPLLQYSGPELHAGCVNAPEECLTRAPVESAVEKALNYLIEGQKVLAFTGGLSAEEKRSLLPHIALERDPRLPEFYAAFVKAHNDLGEIEHGEIEDLRADARKAADIAAGLAGFFAGASPADESARSVLDRARRMAGGFVKDFEDVDSLLDNLQLRRFRRRIGNMLDSEDELKAAGEAAEQSGSGQGDAPASAVALLAEFRDKGLLEKIDQTESRLGGIQVGLLGRPVHSEEHWQYLRELAFKYPVSPIMCCIRRLDNRYMVVPRWDSELARILRDYLERASASPD